VDLSGLARLVAEGLQRQDPSRVVMFTIEDGLEAWADASLIRTVLENLLGNAWKFTGTRAEARIEFGALPAEVGFRGFFVRDNGLGFDPAYKDRLFRPFEQLHEPGQFSGLGIGLSSVERVVERHGGRVWADGAPNVGATFCFTLRAEEDEL
jgi:signal transduction histidine kinase